MLFNSPEFIFMFLPVVVAIYYALRRAGQPASAKAWLVIASLFFYAYWEIKYLALIIISIMVNFQVGRALHRRKSRVDAVEGRAMRSILIFGVVFNLGVLGYFKYADFFIANINVVFGSGFDLLELLLPLAISFFTFQQIAYLVDCYKEDTQEYDFLNYCLFVTFFPQLIAGPIVHHREMMPQFGQQRGGIDWDDFVKGIFIFSVGLFKKTVIADSFSVWANKGFDSDVALTFFDAWGTSLSYTFQLYYDFSGYSDMAIGAALLFGIRLPVNFNSPYKATNIQDFWRRWHMTLSRWLRDYVYIPLGGNRCGKKRALINMFLTFLLGGLWHGAAWTFVAWGAMHGGALVVHRVWSWAGLKMSVYAGWVITFLFVNTTWVFFRAETFDGAIRVLQGMAGMNGIEISKGIANLLNYLSTYHLFIIREIDVKLLLPVESLTFIIIFALVAFRMRNSVQMIGFVDGKSSHRMRYDIRYASLLGFFIFTSFLTFVGDVAPSDFLYFNF